MNSASKSLACEEVQFLGLYIESLQMPPYMPKKLSIIAF